MRIGKAYLDGRDFRIQRDHAVGHCLVILYNAVRDDGNVFSFEMPETRPFIRGIFRLAGQGRLEKIAAAEA